MQLSFWSNDETTLTVRALSTVDRRGGPDGLSRHRTAIYAALCGLREALRAYFTARDLAHPLRTPGDASEQALRRLCDELHAQIALRQNLGLPVGKHRRFLAALGARLPAYSDACGLKPTELDAIWQALPSDKRLGFVMSLNDEAADALLRFQVDRQ